MIFQSGGRHRWLVVVIPFLELVFRIEALFNPRNLIAAKCFVPVVCFLDFSCQLAFDSGKRDGCGLTISDGLKVQPLIRFLPVKLLSIRILCFVRCLQVSSSGQELCVRAETTANEEIAKCFEEYGRIKISKLNHSH